MKRKEVFMSRFTARRHAEDGFSLVETIVAMGIAATVILGMLASSAFATKATVASRQNQQAADLLNRSLEAARSLNYAAVAMVTGQLPGTPADPAFSMVGPARYYNPGTGVEPVEARATGGIAHVQTVNNANGVYTLRQYVTVPVGSGINNAGLPAQKRLTSVVTWQLGSQKKTRKSSTILTETRRGLPLPFFTWTYNGPHPVIDDVPTITKNPGNDVSVGLSVHNLGARDAWKIAASTPGWAFYADTDGDGFWSEDLSTEPLLTGSQTPPLEASSLAYKVVAFRQIPETATAADTPTTFTATSIAQPTVKKDLVTRLLVVAGAVTPALPSPGPTTPADPTETCTPGSDTSTPINGDTFSSTSPAKQYTITTLYLFNGPESGDTSAKPQNVAGSDTNGLQTRLCNWSIDRHVGRRGLDLRSTDVAEWRFQPANPKEDEFAGTAILRVYLQCTTSNVVLSVDVGQLSGTFTSRVRTTRTVTDCPTTGYRSYDVQVPLGATPFTVARNSSQRMVVRLSSSVQTQVLYGSTQAPARFIVAVR